MSSWQYSFLIHRKVKPYELVEFDSTPSMVCVDAEVRTALGLDELLLHLRHLRWHPYSEPDTPVVLIDAVETESALTCLVMHPERGKCLYFFRKSMTFTPSWEYVSDSKSASEER